MMGSEKESHVLRESPAGSVCRSDFMAQFLPDFKCVCENNAHARHNSFAFVIIKVCSSSTIMYVNC